MAERPDGKSTAKNSPEAAKTPVDKPHYHGHRERLREKFSRNGASSLADYELLELLLFRFIPRADTKPVAKELLNRFGSIAGVLGAEERELTQIPKIGTLAARDIKVVAAIASQSLRSEIQERTVLSSWSSVISYCTSTMAHEKVEQFRILFLTRKTP